jgi:hypothetical protein
MVALPVWLRSSILIFERLKTCCSLSKDGMNTMALSVDSPFQAKPPKGPDAAQQAAMKQKFDADWAAAQSAAAGNPTLLAKINAINPQPGAIEELEALLSQALQAKSQNKTIAFA